MDTKWHTSSRILKSIYSIRTCLLYTSLLFWPFWYTVGVSDHLISPLKMVPQYTKLFTVYESPLVVISIRVSSYMILRLYESPLHPFMLWQNKLECLFLGCGEGLGRSCWQRILLLGKLLFLLVQTYGWNINVCYNITC